MHYEKEINAILVGQIEALGYIQVKPNTRPRKAINAFFDPITQDKFITYNSGYIQVESPRSLKYFKLGCTMSPLNPTVNGTRETRWGTYPARKYVMLTTETDRLYRLLSILTIRRAKRAKREAQKLS